MKKYYLITLVLLISLFWLGKIYSQDTRTDKSKLVITTFNTYFMWDGHEPEEGRVDLPYKGDPVAAGEHMEDLAMIIRRINPDIINLVEVEGLAALKRLNDEYLSDMGYRPYLVKGRDSYTGQDVGLLTRITPENDRIERYNNKGNSNGTEKSVSKNYYAKFNVDGNKIAIVSLHFLAIPSKESNIDKRQAQADAIRKLSQQLDDEGYSIMVMGDFNDYDGSFCCRDVNNNIPITTVLRDIKRMDNTTNADDLINVSQYLDQQHRYTAHYDRNRNDKVDGTHEYSSIDHILIAPELEGLVEKVDIDHDFDPIVVSDHFPVTVTFKLGEVNEAFAGIHMISLIPNPSGDEYQNEQITFYNASSRTVDLSGWKVRDAAKKVWKLKGKIDSNEKVSIKRNGQAMGLNNSGDVVELLNPNNKLIQHITYGRADEDEVVLVQ